LAVRKRVLKLLKMFYEATEEHALRVDICSKIVLRMYDEDDSVKDLASKTIEDLWFHTPTNLSPQKPRRATLDTTSSDRTKLLGKVATIMGVSTAFRDRQGPLEDMLTKITSDASEASPIRDTYTRICSALIDGIVDDSDLPGFVSAGLLHLKALAYNASQTIVNCVRTIYLFSVAYPAVLSGSNASILLPYLRNATTVRASDAFPWSLF
jgi:cohesin loading factor subunit SCC2